MGTINHSAIVIVVMCTYKHRFVFQALVGHASHASSQPLQILAVCSWLVLPLYCSSLMMILLWNKGRKPVWISGIFTKLKKCVSCTCLHGFHGRLHLGECLSSPKRGMPYIYNHIHMYIQNMYLLCIYIYTCIYVYCEDAGHSKWRCAVISMIFRCAAHGRSAEGSGAFCPTARPWLAPCGCSTTGDWSDDVFFEVVCWDQFFSRERWSKTSPMIRMIPTLHLETQCVHMYCCV